MRFNAEPLPRRRRGGKGWETLTRVLHEARLVGQAIALRGLSRFAVLATSRQTTKSDRLSHRARRRINELRLGLRPAEDVSDGAAVVLNLSLEHHQGVDQLLRAGRAAGDIDIDGDHLVDRGQRVVVEDAGGDRKSVV